MPFPSFPQFHDQPPCGWAFRQQLAQAVWGDTESGPAYSHAADDARTQLEALPDGYTDYADGVGTAQVAAARCNLSYTSTPGLYTVLTQAFRYILVWHAATCYFKIAWDEVTEDSYIPGDGPDGGVETIVSTVTTHSYSFTAPDVSESGLCVPAGFFATDGPSVWNLARVGDPQVVSLPSATVPGSPTTWVAVRGIGTANVRWSWVKGYFPAGDQPNGWPP